ASRASSPSSGLPEDAFALPSLVTAANNSSSNSNNSSNNSSSNKNKNNNNDNTLIGPLNNNSSNNKLTSLDLTGPLSWRDGRGYCGSRTRRSRH
ncbi:unnamed protein product, partial [Polarella glacialis]